MTEGARILSPSYSIANRVEHRGEVGAITATQLTHCADRNLGQRCKHLILEGLLSPRSAVSLQSLLETIFAGTPKLLNRYRRTNLIKDRTDRILTIKLTRVSRSI